MEVVWTGRGGEWSSAKGLVAPYCNLFSASILFLELPIEVFSSFGTARIIYWPLYFCNKSLWFCSHVAKIQLKVRRANLFLKRSKESRGKEGGEAYFVYSTHFMAGKFRSETEKILKIDLIYGESVTRIDNWHWRSCSQSWQVGGSYLKMCSISHDVSKCVQLVMMYYWWYPASHYNVSWHLAHLWRCS